MTEKRDWTARGGRTNSSDYFENLIVFVAELIRGSAHDLIAGRSESVARLIMAQLAHVKGLVPGSLLATATEQRDNARAIARVLACAYTTGNYPPQHVVDEALAFPAKP